VQNLENFVSLADIWLIKEACTDGFEDIKSFKFSSVSDIVYGN
jgi:hypothetical protein